MRSYSAKLTCKEDSSMNSTNLSIRQNNITSCISGSGSDRTKMTHLMFERYRHILNAIRSDSYPNTTQLARSLEVSVSTVSRDIEFLKERMGCPIEYDFFHKGFHCSENFQLML